MNKAEPIKAVASRLECTQEQTADAMDALMGVVQDTLARGDNVQLVGFGTFAVTARAGREGRNPQTGATLTIPAKKIVKFKPGKILSNAVAVGDK